MIYIIQSGVTVLGVGDNFDNAVNDANKLFEFDPASVKRYPDFDGDVYQHDEYDLDEFIRSDYFAMHRPSFQELLRSDPDRADRIDEAAEDGFDGSTHGEEIQDWRDCWESYCREYDVPDEVCQYVETEMQVTESYHATQGTLEEVIG
jgi:hypothetical protein